MKKISTLAAILLMDCVNATPKDNTPVVEVHSPPIVIEEVQGTAVSKPKEPTLDEKVKYVTSVMEEIQKTEPDAPAQVIRTLPESRDFFETVYFSNMACWKTPRSDQETEEKVLEFKYRTYRDKKSITITLRDYHPFSSVDSVELQIYDYTSRTFDVTFFNTSGYTPLSEKIMQIFYGEFRAHEKKGESWDLFPRGDFYDGPVSEKATILKSSFDQLYEFLEKNKDKGISGDDPDLLDKLHYVCQSL